MSEKDAPQNRRRAQAVPLSERLEQDFNGVRVVKKTPNDEKPEENAKKLHDDAPKRARKRVSK